MKFITFTALICSGILLGQIKTDSIAFPDHQPDYSDHVYKPSYKKLIIPATFIGFGVASLTTDALKNLNTSTKYEIGEHQPKHIKLDNYTQYLPAAMVYGYNLAGIKGKHNFKERTIIYGTSQLISAAFVLPLKHLVKEERPDQSNNLSFPSGHTAAAFSSAHFLFREYQDDHFWLAISGYPIAVFTGVYRTLNDKHWVGDVVAGAGFGILSTELAYWVFPLVNQLFNNNKSKTAMMVFPVLDQNHAGAGFVLNF